MHETVVSYNFSPKFDTNGESAFPLGGMEVVCTPAI
jgi:hypothetical protein